MMKKISKILVLSFLFVSALTAAKPAKAFYLEVPQGVKDILSLFKSQRTLAEDAGTLLPTPPSGETTMPSDMIPPPPSGDQNQQFQSTQQNQTQPPAGNMPMPSGDQRQGMQLGSQMGGEQGQDSAKQLEQMKRGMKQMTRMVKQFEAMIASAEKKGTTVPEEVKQKLEKLKSILDSANNASSMEALQDVDLSETQDLMQSLEEFRQNVIEAQQRMDSMKRGMKGMETGLKMFERQVAGLTKKGTTVPADILEHIAKLKAVVDKVKNAASFDEVREDMESMQDLMETFDQDRQQLEILARWPQSLKQIDRQLLQLTSALKRAKLIVANLAKKDIDLQAEYSAFEEGVNKLKTVRDDAVAKMAAGNAEDAFAVLEDDFFGQIDDVWQNQKVIMTMSNLGKFTAEFRQNIAQANSTIKNLKRKKLDTSNLEALLGQAKDKGQEILDLLKAKPLDTDTISAALDDLENIKQEFESQVSELTGEEESLPWEQGPQQFKRVELPQGFDKLVPQKPEPQTQRPTESSSPLQP